MPKNPWLVQNDKPSYQVLKWIGGGGYGQVFKVIRDGKVRARDTTNNNTIEEFRLLLVNKSITTMHNLLWMSMIPCKYCEGHLTSQLCTMDLSTIAEPARYLSSWTIIEAKTLIDRSKC